MSVRTGWIAISAMFILNGALLGIWASRVPAIAEKFELSHSQLGLLLLALAGGAVCSFPLAGKAIDRYGASFVTRILACVYPITLVALSLAPETVFLGIALFVFGAAHGGMDVSMNGWAAEVERHFARRMMSSFHAMFSFGAGMGALSGYLAIWLEFSLFYHFLISSAFVTVLMLYLANIPWKSKTHKRQKGPIFAFPSGQLLIVGIVAFCSSLGEGAIVDWSAIYLREVVNATESIAALGYVAFSVAIMLARLMGDIITSKLGPVFTTRAGGCIAVLGVLFIILYPSVANVLLGFALLGIGYSVIMPLAFSRAANDPNLPSGQAISSVATLGYGGMLLGPPIIGFISSATNMQVAFGVLGVLALAIVMGANSME